MARFKMETSGTWEVQQCPGVVPGYADRTGEFPSGKQRHRWKSDPLIVLRARESRAHGEAAGPESPCSGTHSPYSEMDDG